VGESSELDPIHIMTPTLLMSAPETGMLTTTGYDATPARVTLKRARDPSPHRETSSDWLDAPGVDTWYVVSNQKLAPGVASSREHDVGGTT